MTTMYIAASHQTEGCPLSHCLGDVITSIKVAWLWVQMEKPDHVILSLCRHEQWNVLWDRFIRENNVFVVWDEKVDSKWLLYRDFDIRRQTRIVHGAKFDTYKELYCRMEGGQRQAALCGQERGLGRKNIFEYFYHGQESFVPNPSGSAEFGSNIIDFDECHREPRVLIAPHAKCQGNDVFTFAFWGRVTQSLIDANIPFTLNDTDNRIGIPGLKATLARPEEIANYVARHSLVVCGNTGIGWVAGATGTPLFGMEPPWFNMMDFRYRECGVKSLKALFSDPDPNEVANAIIDFMNGKEVKQIKNPVPVTTARKLENMVNWLNQAPRGPVVEVGVFEGGSIIHLAKRFPNRQFFGIDTFEGCPMAGENDNFHKEGDFVADFESVKQSCSRYDNITLIKGRLPNVAMKLPQDIVLAHIDVDLYQSTKQSLQAVIQNMATVSRIYCDDCFMDTCHGATIAMCEVSAAIGKPLKIDHGLHGAICFGD